MLGYVGNLYNYVKSTNLKQNDFKIKIYVFLSICMFKLKKSWADFDEILLCTLCHLRLLFSFLQLVNRCQTYEALRLDWHYRYPIICPEMVNGYNYLKNIRLCVKWFFIKCKKMAALWNIYLNAMNISTY